MVEKEIEIEYEHTELRTDADTVLFCDSCGDPTDRDDAVELTNISVDCVGDLVDRAFNTGKSHHPIGSGPAGMRGVDTLYPTDDASKALDDALDASGVEAFHFCPGCQQSIRDTQAVVAPEYTPPTADDGTDTDTDGDWLDLSPTAAVVYVCCIVLVSLGINSGITAAVMLSFVAMAGLFILAASAMIRVLFDGVEIPDP